MKENEMQLKRRSGWDRFKIGLLTTGIMVGGSALCMADTVGLGIDFTAAQTTATTVGTAAVASGLILFGGKLAVRYGKSLFNIIFR